MNYSDETRRVLDLLRERVAALAKAEAEHEETKAKAERLMARDEADDARLRKGPR